MLTIYSNQTADTLLNPALLIPPRPTISNIQWLSGTQHVTPADMDLLIGGPNRPPSKRQLAQNIADAEHARQAERRANQPGASASGVPPTGYPAYPANRVEEEGWGAWASRNLAERTEKLGLAGDGMEQLSSNSKGWADDVNKFVGKQKRGLVMGAVKSKFGF
jgi:syntaxin-binding protein 5